MIDEWLMVALDFVLETFWDIWACMYESALCCFLNYITSVPLLCLMSPPKSADIPVNCFYIPPFIALIWDFFFNSISLLIEDTLFWWFLDFFELLFLLNVTLGVFDLGTIAAVFKIHVVSPYASVNWIECNRSRSSGLFCLISQS